MHVITKQDWVYQLYIGPFDCCFFSQEAGWPYPNNTLLNTVVHLLTRPNSSVLNAVPRVGTGT